MQAIFALSIFYLKMLLKQRATQLMIVLAIVLNVVAWLLSDVNIAQRFKLFEDVLLASQLFLLHLLALFYVFEFLQKERIGGMFILPIASGVSRKSYLLAQFLTLFLVVAIFLGALLLIDGVSLLLIESSWRLAVLWQLALYGMSAYFLALLVVVLSYYVSVMNAIIYAIALYFLGNGLDELYAFAFHYHVDALMQKLYYLLIYIIPNFSLFDHSGAVVNRADLPLFSFVIHPLLYAMALGVVLFFIGWWKFSKKALKVGS